LGTPWQGLMTSGVLNLFDSKVVIIYRVISGFGRLSTFAFEYVCKPY
jgi:hypothetical protein